MAKYYCVLFDADNTLLNFDAAESKALAETLVNYGIEPDAETVQTYRTINSELWRQLEKGQIKREKLMAERFTRFLKAIDAAGDGAEMNRFYLEQLSTHPDLMGPEVLDVLRELSEVATLAVVTNGFQKVQIRRLAESGVLNFMEDVFVSEKMDSEKPNRRIFDAALRALGVENREHVLVVGDGLSSDIQGGVNAGLDTCWYNPSHAENPGKVVPTYEIADLNLEKMAGQMGYGVESSKEEEKTWKVVLHVSGQEKSAEEIPADSCLVPAKKKTVVAVTADHMGEGNEELGKVLIKGFLFAQTQLETLPDTILFYNGGAKLTCEGSDSIEDLKKLEEAGVQILTCGTCLNYYGLTEKLKVGGVTNMYVIAQTMAEADLVVRP